MAVPTFTNTGSIPNVTVDAFLVAPRYQKFNLDCRISGSGVTNVLPRSEVHVRPAGGGSARQCFWADKQPNANTGGSSVFGMATNLSLGTSYDVSEILSDGTNTQEVVALNQTTLSLPSSLPAALLATATHYIREDGNDTNAGTADSAGGAWRTLGKAMSTAPAGAVVSVQGGAGGKLYPRCLTVRTLGAITFVSTHPAADDTARDSGGPQDPNPGAHATLVEWKVQPTTGPAGATPGTLCATAPAAETDTRFQGPNGSKWTLFTHSSLGYTCWVWDAPGTPIGSPQFVSWSTTKSGAREKLGVYAQQAGVVDSADRACELLNTIRDASYGCVYLTIAANSTENSKLYLKLPPQAGTTDPNTLYLWAGGGLAGDSKGLIEITTPNVRICGLDFKDAIHGVWLGVGADNLIVDHCAFSNHWVGVMARGTQNAAVNSTYPNNVLIWRTRTVVTNLWSEDQVNRPSYPWAYIKALVGKQGQAATIWRPFDGATNYANRRLANNCEQNACWGKGGATNLSFLENHVDGVFNGVSGDHTGFDLYAMYGLEVYGNLFRHLADDTFEPEQKVANWECHHNRAEDVITAVSTASHEIGPMLVHNNVWVRIGVHGMRAVAEDIPGQTWATGGSWKYKVSIVSAPLCAFVSNTVHCLNPNLQWTPTGYQLRNSDGRFSAGGSLNTDIRFWEANNIYMGFNRDAIITGNPGGNSTYPTTNLQWTEDYNYFHSTGDGPSGAGRGQAYAGTNYTSTSAYRTATTHGATKPQQGTHSNDGLPGGGLSNTTYRVAPYLAPNNQFDGDVTAGYAFMGLKAGSVFIDAGVVVPGMMDRAGVDYAGAAPDLGAVQTGLGAAPTPPAAPTGLTATKNGSSIINLAWTDVATDETSYVVRRSLDGATNWSIIDTLAAGSTAYSNTGLPGLATRFYQVGATNAAGTSYSNVASATTDASATVPAQPQSLLATAPSYTSIALAWIDAASNEISYRDERSDDGVTGWATLSTLGINATADVDTSLLAGTTKYYRVFAVNAVGDSLPSNVASATTPVPTAGPGAGGRVTGPRVVASRTWATRTLATHSTLLIPFDNHPGENVQLNGDYPTGIINWGTALWYISTVFAQQYSSKILTYWDSLNDGSANSESFTFVAPKILVSVKMFNSSVGSITITVTGAGGESKVQAVAAGALATITTGFTIPATTITLASTHGWHTNFDDLVIL